VYIDIYRVIARMYRYTVVYIDIYRVMATSLASYRQLYNEYFFERIWLIDMKIVKNKFITLFRYYLTYLTGMIDLANYIHDVG